MNERLNESTSATIKSIIINIVLTIFKILSGIIGSSNAMIADGIHSASDIITSIGVLAGNIISKKPDDDEHNYGHEKAETLVGFTLSLVLIYVGFKIGYNSLLLMFNLDKIKTPTYLPIIAALVSIALKEYQFYITIKIAKKINSPSLKADAWHHRSDSLSSIGALLGIIGSRIGFKILDPLSGFIVCILVLKVGLDILKTSANELLDYSITKQEQEKIKDLIMTVEGVNYVTSFKSRKHGSYIYIDLSICVDPNITVYKGHEIAHKVEDKIKENIENIKAVAVHIDACTVRYNQKKH
ncbi:cation diffusion facilitator family transporter [Alkalithermobacter thermoalcaliphilus JW-YL-7 = DSM 7308]|uniref:Cation diffusion facilitator family transporter n=1 Tax=Alkalithermobacter thermoalcaliphilus JW-YL-7 = DSM 7308 TaxID=1121328 RepID=A0A150FSK5_CLOPD|nr:cation diffusion facilitator family transporter [[Clostridium] paradoxum JW-YL-7 = DSM 7308]SHK68942.1 cation diffusion facilitator family transporter [[Clostridium] paradoxum JW-YL-7 = DSM 7308]